MIGSGSTKTRVVALDATIAEEAHRRSVDEERGARERVEALAKMLAELAEASSVRARTPQAVGAIEAARREERERRANARAELDVAIGLHAVAVERVERTAMELRRAIGAKRTVGAKAAKEERAERARRDGRK